MKDVKDILFNVCTVKNKAECEFMGRSCDSCTKLQVVNLHPYISFLFSTRGLIERGWRPDKNDFYLETWLDFSVLESTIHRAYEKKRRSQRGST